MRCACSRPRRWPETPRPAASCVACSRRCPARRLECHGALRVPLDYWLAAAPVVGLEPRVGRVPELCTAAVCEWLIDRARTRLERALVYDAVEHARDGARDAHQHARRTSTTPRWTWCSSWCRRAWRRPASSGCSSSRRPRCCTTRWASRSGRTSTSSTRAPPTTRQQIREQGQRMITFLLYLNEGYEGGETTFPELGIVNHGRRGDGLYFINSRADRSADRQMRTPARLLRGARSGSSRNSSAISP